MIGDASQAYKQRTPGYLYLVPTLWRTVKDTFRQYQVSDAAPEVQLLNLLTGNTGNDLKSERCFLAQGVMSFTAESDLEALFLIDAAVEMVSARYAVEAPLTDVVHRNGKAVTLV